MDETATINRRLETLSDMYHEAWKKYVAAQQIMNECDRALRALEVVREENERRDGEFNLGMRTEAARFKWYNIVKDLRKTTP